jgi:type I restriction enzyme M protein
LKETEIPYPFEKSRLIYIGMSEKKTKVGYEISFTKYFYKYKPLRPLDEITGDIKTLEEETRRLMEEILKI